MKTTNTADVAVIVARFQCPILHEGHIDIIEQVKKQHPRVIIFLGVSGHKCSYKNPLDYDIRRWMVNEKYPYIETYPIHDVGDNKKWSQTLDTLIRQYIGPQLKVVLYGGRDSFLKAYSGKFPTLELIPNKFISATEIRRAIGIKPIYTEDFRKGIVHCVENQYPAVVACADIFAFNKSNGKVLIIRKPDETFYRFAGGHAEPNSLTYEDDAVREMKEETQVIVSDPEYIGSALIDDPRWKEERDKVKTILFASTYISGIAHPNDDVEGGEAVWKDPQFIDYENFMLEHRPLVDLFKKWANRNNLLTKDTKYDIV